MFLSLPWAVLELPKLLNSTVPVVFDPVIMISNAAAAFGLNLSVFLLIGKVSGVLRSTLESDPAARMRKL